MSASSVGDGVTAAGTMLCIFMTSEAASTLARFTSTQNDAALCSILYVCAAVLAPRSSPPNLLESRNDLSTSIQAI